MKQYPEEFKAGIITKLLAPHNADISALAKEKGYIQSRLMLGGLSVARPTKP